MSKPFLAIADQIKLLKDRGVIFINETQAAKELTTYGYYEIINGYKDPFLEDHEKEIYKANTTFEDIYALFYLDSKIRISLIESLEFLEAGLRQYFAYTIAEQHTEIISSYLNTNVFYTGKKLKYPNPDKHLFVDRDIFLKKMKRIINSSEDPFHHYQDKYCNTPPWILVKGMSLGELLRGIILLNPKDKKLIVSRIFDREATNEFSYSEMAELLSGLLKVVLDYRNRAAHGGRIYNYLPKDSLAYNQIFFTNKLGISKNAYVTRPDKRMNLNILLELLNLLDNSYPAHFLAEGISTAISSYSKKFDKQIEFILQQTGFQKTN